MCRHDLDPASFEPVILDRALTKRGKETRFTSRIYIITRFYAPLDRIAVRWRSKNSQRFVRGKIEGKKKNNQHDGISTCARKRVKFSQYKLIHRHLILYPVAANRGSRSIDAVHRLSMIWRGPKRIKDRNLFEDPSPLSSVTWSLVRFECQAELNWSPRGLKRLSILLLPLLPPSFPFTPPSLFTVFLSHLVSCLQRENSHCVRETRNTSLVWPHLSLSLSFFHSFSFSLLTSL